MTLVDTEASFRAERGTGGRWLTGLSGVAWIVIALIVLQFDLDSAATIGYLVGGVLIVMGVNEFVLLGALPGWHWLHIALGVLFILGGITGFIAPFQTFGIMAHLFGFLLLVKGTADVTVAVATRDVVDLWWMTLISGILQIALGFWATGYPGRSARLLILWVGLGAIIRGITLLARAFQGPGAQRAVA